jgi:ComF family protein
LDIAHTKPLYCGECLKKPPDYDTTIAPLIYQDAVVSLITRLKFYHNFAAARLFAELIADRAIARYSISERPKVLIPVPLHTKRLRLRGYNQATLLANHLAKLTKIPVNRHFCRRIHHTLPQSKTSADLRHSNLLGAFAIGKASEAEHVALIDDVMTTGATVGTLSQVLKAQGVKRVSVWCIARA